MSDEDVKARLRQLLLVTDLATTTEKMLRKKLEEEMGIDLTDKKLVIRAEIDKILEETQPADEEGGSEEQEEEQTEPEKKAAISKQSGSGRGTMLSDAMQEFLGQESCPRGQVVKALWVYIKEHNLQDPKDKRKILLDAKLGTIFPGKRLDMFSMNKKLSRHCWIDDSIKPAKTLGKSADTAPAQRPSKRSLADDGDVDVPQEKAKRVCGFTMAFKVSKVLADFVGKEEISRPDLTKFVAQYANDNNLRTGKVVACDATLRALTKQDSFENFGCIKHFSHHFPASKSAKKK